MYNGPDLKAAPIKGEPHVNQETKTPLWHWLLLVAILLVAAFLRFYRLDVLPRGPYYDEAANTILTGEIARGEAYPLFIRSYTGKEVLFFYLSAGMMKLLGVNLFALRLTSAFVGLVTIAVTFPLARELFDEQPEPARRGLALCAMALMAVNFWHISISRYGFRAISLPLMAALTLLFLWRGLRRGGWKNVILAGVFCGATAYTYLSCRIVPLALIPWVAGIWLVSSERRRTAGRILVFGLVAAVVVAPLAIFFITNPEAFGARIGQVSLFNPELNEEGVARTLLRAIGAGFGMFTVRGDMQSRFGIIGRPVFDPVVGAFFYLGLLYALYRTIRGPRPIDRVLYLSLLVWVPVLLIPSIMAVREVPHSLRAIGVMPVMFFFPGLGIVALARWLYARWDRLRWLAAPVTGAAVAGLLLVSGGITAGWDYQVVWGNRAAPYYENDNDLADAARYLNQLDLGEREIFASAMHYRHPTVALLADSYARIHWSVDGHVLAFPPVDGPGAVYVFPRSALPAPALLDLLDQVAVAERHLGPDGDTAFLIYQLPAGVTPPISPQYPAQVDFGHEIELIGYDLPPVTAGEPLVATLYWRVLAPSRAEDYLLFSHLRDLQTLHWSGSDPFDYPSAEWKPGHILVQRREIPVPALTPPGTYELLVGFSSRGQNARLPRLDQEGRVAGTTASLGPVTIAQASTPPTDLSSIQQRIDETFDGLRLLGYRRDQATIHPGETYYMGLFWQAEANLPDLDIGLSMAGGEENPDLPLSLDRPVHGTFSTAEWRVGTILLDQYGLTIPHDAPPGVYTVTLTVFDRRDGQMVGAPVPLAELNVERVDRRTIVPPIGHPLEVNLGDQVQLLGYDLDRTEVTRGGTLHVTLYWRATAQMETSYTVFNHLLDETNQISGQQDNRPVGDTYPTTLWMPQEVVTDEYTLTVKPDAAPGTHVIEVGMYVAETGQRLPVLDTAGQVTGDRILIGEVQVTVD